MIVRDLIRVLEAMPQDWRVILDGAYDGVGGLECIGVENNRAAEQAAMSVWDRCQDGERGERVVTLYGSTRT